MPDMVDPPAKITLIMLPLANRDYYSKNHEFRGLLWVSPVLPNLLFACSETPISIPICILPEIEILIERFYG
jgi:hypothetical protein